MDIVNRIQTHFDKRVQQIDPDTDFGREILYKMCVAFNLSLSRCRT